MAAPRLSVLLFFFIGLRIYPALGAVPRFGAVNDATLLPAAGFAPRRHMEGIPAVPAQPLSPNPRHVLGGHRLSERQGICQAGFHSCVEANAAGYCCPNDRYCYLDKDWTTQCCSLGVTCPDSVCGPDQLYCNLTSTATVAVGTTSAGQDDISSILSYSTYSTCCNRACKTTAYLCEQTFGGKCCPYSYKCALSGSCIADPAPSTSTSISTIVSIIPSGCTTSQITCTEGGRCCNFGSICTFQSVATGTAKAVCAPDPALSNGGGLSSGAKAGIGVGVAVGAAIIIAAVTWLCIRQRRKRSGTTGAASLSAHEMRHDMMGEHVVRSADSGVGDPDVDNSVFVGPASPWSPRSDGSGNFLSSHGYNYIGPDAVPGPYTDQGGDEYGTFDPGLATTPPTAIGDGAPFHPNNILRPVEIGAGQAHGDDDSIDTEEKPAQDEEPATGPFELMGSLGTPSPLNSDEPSQPTGKGPSISSPVGSGPKE